MINFKLILPYINTKQTLIAEKFACVILGPNPRASLELFMSLKPKKELMKMTKMTAKTAAVGEMLLSHAPLGRWENN